MRRKYLGRTVISVVAIVGLAMLNSMAPAFCDPVATSATPVIPTVTLPAGTPVALSLQQSLQSGSSKIGDVVTYQVLQPVIVDHQVLIPAGAMAYGIVTESKKPGIFGVPGKLAFSCEYIQVPGTHIPLKSDPQTRSGVSQTGNMIGSQVKSTAMGAAMSGGVPTIGPGIALGFLHGGGNVSVPAGQKVTMYVASDTPVIAIAPPSVVAGGTPPVTTLVLNGETLFILKSGEQVTGKLLGYDGAQFQISTPQGNRTVAAADVAAAKAL